MIQVKAFTHSELEVVHLIIKNLLEMIQVKAFTHSELQVVHLIIVRW